MPSKKAQTIWIQQFKGQYDMISPGANPEYSPDTQNVKVMHNGHVYPRGGMDGIIYGSFAENIFAEIPIIGIWTYPNTTRETQLVAMTPGSLFSFSISTGTWGDITGDSLSGNGQTIPQSTIIDDTLIVVTEGNDLPQKWSVVDAVVASTIGNGSTPPFAKSIEAYLGFLFLGNVSDDGTFTDVTDGHRTIMYSDDWDNDWNGCAGNRIVLDETPGGLLRMITLGKDVMCFKEDGIVKVRWVGGSVKFQQEKLKFDLGLAGPLLADKVNDELILFVATDGIIYSLTESGIQPISEDALARTIPAVVPYLKLHWGKAMHHNEDSIAYFFYASAGQSGGDANYNDVYVGYNYREKTFFKGVLGLPMTACANHKWSPSARERLFVTSGADFNKVLRFDDPLETDDDGEANVRYYVTNWVGMGEEGWLVGGRFLFGKEPFNADIYQKEGTLSEDSPAGGGGGAG